MFFNNCSKQEQDTHCVGFGDGGGGGGFLKVLLSAPVGSWGSPEKKKTINFQFSSLGLLQLGLKHQRQSTLIYLFSFMFSIHLFFFLSLSF